MLEKDLPVLNNCCNCFDIKEYKRQKYERKQKSLVVMEPIWKYTTFTRVAPTKWCPFSMNCTSRSAATSAPLGSHSLHVHTYIHKQACVHTSIHTYIHTRKYIMHTDM